MYLIATKDLSSPSDALTSQTPKDTIITFPDSEPKHDHVSLSVRIQN